MGYNSARFLKPLDDNLLCGICSGVLENPLLTPCGHTFCENCINKWLDTPGVKSCPECRSPMDKGSTRPILSLRNLIGDMDVTCPNKSRGCNDVIKIDTQNTHLQTCSYESVTCVGCNLEMNRAQLPLHQMDCSALIALLQDEVDDSPPIASNETSPTGSIRSAISWQLVGTSQQCPQRTGASQSSSTSTQLLRLLHRVSALEKQVVRLLDDLQEAHFKNSLLYLQNKKLKEEDEQRQQKLARRLAQSQPSTFTYDFSTITNQQDIAKLSLYIARNLLEKPVNIESDKVFSAVRKCYEMHFYHTGTDSRVEHDVHMLLATAFASTWFNSAQRITLGCWLQCVHKCQGCRQVLQGDGYLTNIKHT